MSLQVQIHIVSIGFSGLATSVMGGWMIGSVGFRPFLLTAVAITLIGVAIFWFNFLKDADTNVPTPRRPGQ